MRPNIVQKHHPFWCLSTTAQRPLKGWILDLKDLTIGRRRAPKHGRREYKK